MDERIDHAAEAVKHIEWAHDQQSKEGEFEFTIRDNALIAQAEATLALVEQQRVANLIALNLAREPITMDSIVGAERKLKPEIKEALGL